MSVCSTKTRTAALSVRTRWHPGSWCGSRRPVRSISANSLPIVVWRSIVISRNCSQNSGSTVIDVSRPLILTWCRQLSFQRCLSHCWRRHLTSDSQSDWRREPAGLEFRQMLGHLGTSQSSQISFSVTQGWSAFGGRFDVPARGSEVRHSLMSISRTSRVVLAPATSRLGRAKPAALSVVKRSELTTMRVSRLAWIALGESAKGEVRSGTSPWPATKTAPAASAAEAFGRAAGADIPPHCGSRSCGQT
jgi:hypothetical protein